jgi:Protein of unknown function (DUF2489)
LLGSLNENNSWVIIALGLVAIPALLLIIRKQWQRIKVVERERDALALRREQQSEELVRGINILCRSMIDDQVELSEGCMRVKILMDHLNASLHEDIRFGVFNEVYSQLEDMPRFKARKSVNKRFLNVLDERRSKIEAENREAILSASKELLAYLGTPLS